MTSLFSLLVSASLLSVLAESVYIRKEVPHKNYQSYSSVHSNKKGSVTLVFIIAVILSLFSGLRTGFNDTYAYIQGFINRIPPSFSYISEFNFSLWDNSGFFIYQVLIKQYISTDPQAFLLISAFIANFLFVFFYYKYSPKFSLTIFIYIASGLFVFSMAGMKQMFAMAIGIWAVHYYLNNKWIVFALLLLLAATIHPYILIYASAPLFIKKMWSLREWVIIFFAVLGALYFEALLTLVIDAHEVMGEDLSYELLMGSGVNIYRLLVYAVTPALAFIYRKKLRALQNPILTLSVNFSVITFIFMFISLWGNPALLARMAIYFEPFSYLALTYIVMNCFRKGQRIAISALLILNYSLYFYYQFAIAQPFVYESILGTL